MTKKVAKKTPEHDLSPRDRAVARDHYVRAFDEQFSNWVSIAKCCVDVENDRDWELLGFESYGKWLQDAAPRSRSYLYLVIGRYKELLPDIPEKELQQIPLGSAGILKQLSSKIRQNPKVRKAASSKPAELRQVLEQEFPSQHIESVVEKHLKFPLSQWEKIETCYETYKLTDETATLEEFIEWLVSEQP
jgi:hypothetical protein